MLTDDIASPEQRESYSFEVPQLLFSVWSVDPAIYTSISVPHASGMVLQPK